MTSRPGVTGEREQRPHGTGRISLAVLIACHNRRSTTVNCLEHLGDQQVEGLETEVFLVDDGSTDGTSGAVRARFPEVEILPGTGGLFWSGGMRLAMDAALSSDTRFSYLLWLNDDTFLHPGALQRLVDTHRQLRTRRGRHSIVAGAVTDPDTGQVSYSGVRRLWPLPFFVRLGPKGRPRACSTSHGNCVLIPEAVAREVGNIDSRLTHARGDFDYGLRARRAGFDVHVAPAFVGTCRFAPVGSWRDVDLPLRQRLDALHDTKYAFEEKALVARRHFGLLHPLALVAPYVYIYSTHVSSLFRRGRPG